MKKLTNARDILEQTRIENPQAYSEIMEDVEKKKQAYIHGGRRVNAGRKKTLYPKITCSFSLPNEIIIIIENYSKENNLSKSQALEELLKKGIIFN